MTLSIVSRTGPLGSVDAVFLFASGECLAVWLESTAAQITAAQIRHASSGQIAVTLPSPTSRIYATERDGPLAVLTNPMERGAGADLELWNVMDATRVARLATIDAGTGCLGPIIGASCVAFMRFMRPRSASGALVRFDRAGTPLGDLPLPQGTASPVLASAEGPTLLPDITGQEVEIVNPVSGSRITLEGGVPIVPGGRYFQRWTLDPARTHLACIRAYRLRLWQMATGSCIRGGWDDRDLRQGFIAGSTLCAVAVDQTFITYSLGGEVVASGGTAVSDPETPRPTLVDDRHVAFLTADRRGVSVWNVWDGTEVARIEAIQGLGPLTFITGCGGRIAVTDGQEAVVLSIRD